MSTGRLHDWDHHICPLFDNIIIHIQVSMSLGAKYSQYEAYSLFVLLCIRMLFVALN